MVIDKYRFLETMGEGGESNPCYKPLFDETIYAPIKHKVEIDGSVKEKTSLKSANEIAQQHLTIGPASNFSGQLEEVPDEDEQDAAVVDKSKGSTALTDLFQPPE